MTGGAKSKLTCYSCGSNYMLDLSKVPPGRKALKCIKCGKPIPLLDRILAEKKGSPAPPAQEAAAAPRAKLQEKRSAFDELPPPAPLAAPEDSGEGWLAIYGDMMSILLLFFVLMFAISTIDKNKFQTVVQAVSQALGGGVKFSTAPPEAAPTKQSPVQMLNLKVTKENQALGKLKEQLQALTQKEGLQDKFALKDENKGLVLIGQDQTMFDSGKAEIKPEIRPFLARVGHILSGLAQDIEVEGHTDNVPIKTAEFASNWELSARRATNVVHFLVDKAGLNPAKLSAAGYAFYRPRYSFDGTEAAKNRRIEIVIKKQFDRGALRDILDLK